MRGTRTKRLVASGQRPQPRHIREGHRSINRRGRVVSLDEMLEAEIQTRKEEKLPKIDLKTERVMGYRTYSDEVVVAPISTNKNDPYGKV